MVAVFLVIKYLDTIFDETCEKMVEISNKWNWRFRRGHNEIILVSNKIPLYYIHDNK